jgi:hypothetical protein
MLIPVLTHLRLEATHVYMSGVFFHHKCNQLYKEKLKCTDNKYINNI